MQYIGVMAWGITAWSILSVIPWIMVGIQYGKNIWYKWKRKRYGGAGVRIFVVGKNGHIFTELQRIDMSKTNTPEINTTIGSDTYTFHFREKAMRTLSAGWGIWAGEKALVYAHDSTEPIVIEDNKQKTVDPKTMSMVVDSKIAIEAFTASTDNGKQNIVMYIVIAVVGYLVASQMGWI